MRKRILGTLAALAFVSVAAVWGGNDARADNGPHSLSKNNMTTDTCAGCHRAHTAKSEMLLAVSATNTAEFCYTCHAGGAGATTNVKNGISTATLGGALKAGGFEYAELMTDDPSYRIKATATTPEVTAKVGVRLAGVQETTSAHTVDGSEATVWGSGALGQTSKGANVEMSCVACHDPHGNANYRILRSVPAAPLAGVSPETKLGVTYGGGVVIPDQPAPKVYTTTNYWDISYLPATMGVAANSASPAPIVSPGPTVTEVGISAWCSQCHQRYLAPPGAYEVDSGDENFRYRHATEGQSSTGSARPQCVTCHVSHGTNAQMPATGHKPDGTNYTRTSPNSRARRARAC